MASRDEVTLPASRPRSRKSLAHIPTSRTMDQENMTADIASISNNGKRVLQQEKSNRKARSKSIGPGGLDALTDTSGNRRKSLASIPPSTPRSILKPTMPPLREIPAHKSSRNASPKKKTAQEARSPKSSGQITSNNVTITGANNLANPFEIQSTAAVSETRVTLRTEEEQQAAAREREDKERREMEKEVNARREARRKSLANRRVSFAPEATLHTWDVVVEYQDSTTSSSSTRRASSASGISAASPQPRTPEHDSHAVDPPSTPPEQVEEETISATPEHQRELHQKKRRRSSGIPPMNFNNPDDEFMSSSPFSGDSVGEDEQEVEDDGLNSNSESEDDDGTTMMSMDGGETTDMSMASMKSASSTGSDRLDKALREAAQQAGTRGIDYDENGQQSEDESIVASFAPWPARNGAKDLESKDDQENVNPFTVEGSGKPSGGDSEDEEMTMDITSAIGAILPAQRPADAEEESMDVTKALGGILSAGPRQNGQKPHNRRQSLRQMANNLTKDDDMTMDFTMAVGGITVAKPTDVSNMDGELDEEQEEEEMTMDFTTVMGGVLPSFKTHNTNISKAPKTISEMLDSNGSPAASSADDATMDMTMAVGGIVQKTDADNPLHVQDETMGMEMTTAIGSILQPQRSAGTRSQARKIMEMEADNASSPFHIDAAPPPKKSNSALPIASETGSPIVAFKGRSLRRSTERRTSSTPKSQEIKDHALEAEPTTPSKQMELQAPRSAIPSKTPPSKNVVVRSASPKKLFKEELKASSTPQSKQKSSTTTPNKLFQQDKVTGLATPSFVLTPKQRRSSGVGLDKAGLGSPRVAAILDRRRSIGEQAKSFTPGQSPDLKIGVRFQDPRILENEIDDERAQEMAREDGKSILEREVDMDSDDKDATVNLKEMIQSLTPKKNPLRGRKSLHVGAATGLLGKRPIELDDDEDDDEGGVKRLKGHQRSPVKSVRLQGPPSKAETTGRPTRSARRSLEPTHANATPTAQPLIKDKPTTPKGQGRFRDAESATKNVPLPLPPSEKTPINEDDIDNQEPEDDRIQLQDFLNMTSIRFMELTTTKRRHTVAPRSSTKDLANEIPASLEDCVAAGASTIPMLELFQHACSELKKYISEGRKTVREIETETFEENPPLFQEYISASPDMKIFMDNQLKNVKTHARLLSKASWYEWRMTLLGTLKEGLIRTAEGMILDEEKLDEQQNLLEEVLPQLREKSETLRLEEAEYILAAEELANCNPEELKSARQQLSTLDADLFAKQQLLRNLQSQLEHTEQEMETSKQRKQRCLEEIRDAETVREDCRGWSSVELQDLKDKVEIIEKTHGWTITGSSGNTISMTYRKDIELVFDPSSFNCTNFNTKNAKAARIDLWYIGSSREVNPQPIPPEKDFFLQSIRDHVRGLPQEQTSIKDLLYTVTSAWDKALAVVNDIRLINISCPTEVAKTSDTSISIQCSLLIAALATKVGLTINLESNSMKDGIDFLIRPTATVVYGERFNESKISEQLGKKFGGRVGEDVPDRESWAAIIADLGEKLLARGRK